jgi:hypothetical protein
VDAGGGKDEITSENGLAAIGIATVRSTGTI